MAKKNLKKLTALSIAYNVPFQPLYTKEAIAKNNLEVVHMALINGQKVTCLQQLNNMDYEKLFKGETLTESTTKQDNTTVFTKKGTVSINGNRYNMLDLIKDMDMVNVYEIVDHYIGHGEDWQYDMACKIRDYIKNGGFIAWLEYQYQKEYGETVEQYESRMACEGVEV